jgi:DNA-binding beta-propeller fold protein YncE
MEKTVAKSMLKCALLFCLILSGLLAGAAPFPKPGVTAGTPVLASHLDADTYRGWLAGKEETVQNPPTWVLWTADGPNVGHSGVRFGTDKVPGPRHLRIGFKESVNIGSLLVAGNVRVSVLKRGASYPGSMADDNQWLPASRFSQGNVTGKQTSSGSYALWILPPGTTTRALRFTHEAAETDATYEGYIAGVLVFKERMINVAPFAIPAAKSNNKAAGRLVNERFDGWGAWENVNMDSAANAKRPVVSGDHPEWVMLSWNNPVELDALMGVWCGFSAAEVQVYTGPSQRHPREALETDWQTVAEPSSFDSGYPSTMWPHTFSFGRRIKTRAIRLKITSPQSGGHPHVVSKPMGGKRVWLGEVLALCGIGNTAASSIEWPKKESAMVSNPPIPVPFTIPEAGYVTLVIEDSEGMRIRNLVSETYFPAGRNIAWWDGTDDLGRDIDAAKHGLYSIPARFVEPGEYTARGIWRKDVKAFYEFSVYAHGDPPWSLPDHTGGWLANHSPPSAAVFVPASHSPTKNPAVFLGAYVTEGPDGLAWVDLDGRKRGGMKWVGGHWTAAPFLCRDMAPEADTGISAYVGSVWETQKSSGVDELRITALTRSGGSSLRTKVVYKAVLEHEAFKNKSKRQNLGGIAAYEGKVACSFPGSDILLLVDTNSGQLADDLKVSNPRGLTYDSAGRLYVLSGTSVVRFNRADKLASATSVELVKEGLEDPSGLALDAEGNIYVSDRGTSHQVKIFDPSGKFIRTIGLQGIPRTGSYEPLHMNNPAGIAVDELNQIWVTENDYLPKRVSVWSRDGRLIKAFYGPGKYGGGGMLDAHNGNRFYYADEGRGMMEFEVDWKKGEAKLISVLFRQGPDSLVEPFRSAAPEIAFYRDGQRYFANCYNSNPTGGRNTATLFIEREGEARPIVILGLANDWEILKTDDFRHLWPDGKDLTKDRNRDGGINQVLFVWVDANEDGQVQPEEVAMQQGRVGGVTVMPDLSFCVSRVDGRAMRFYPTRFSETGIPFYDLSRGKVLAEGVDSPRSSGGDQMLADDSDEAIITLGIKPFHSHSICGVKAGRATWSYPNPWPGLHASHHADHPTFPGQVIGATRLLGGFVEPKGSTAGPLWAINGNMGNFYIFTRDGLFVATIFKDVRQGKLWKMSVARRGMPLDGISLHDENFWPSISQTPDGQIYIVDGANCSLVRLDGLETLRRIPPTRVSVKPEHLAMSAKYVQERELLRQRSYGSGVLSAAIRAEPPVVDGDLSDWKGADWAEIDRRGAGANFNSNAKPYNILGALAVSGGKLYAAWDTSESRLLENSGEELNALFKTGGALDLMLSTRPAAKLGHSKPEDGDLRLLVTRTGNKTQAMLYRQVVSGTPKSEKIPFSSPWRTVMFDRVEDVSAHVELASDGKGSFEISVPLDLLGFSPKPGMRIAGDIGVLRGNGSETTARIYWSNKATGITSDVPSEAELAPSLWGVIEWKEQ